RGTGDQHCDNHDDDQPAPAEPHRPDHDKHSGRDHDPSQLAVTDLVWIIARSTGTAALVALVLSVLSGMALRSGALAWLSHNRGVRAVHDLTSVLWLPLAIAHVIALLLDPYAKIGLVELVVS